MKPDCRIQRPPLRRPAIALAVAALILNGCGERSLADLEAFVSDARSAPAPAVEPLCSHTRCAPYVPGVKYDRTGKRDPFTPFYVTARTPADPTANPAPHPDPHPPEELERYPLDSLRMIGTVARGDEQWALVRAPDGIVHRVRSGNYVGKNAGRVRAIEEHRIAVTEVIWTGNAWEDREASLALVEG